MLQPIISLAFEQPVYDRTLIQRWIGSLYVSCEGIPELRMLTLAELNFAVESVRYQSEGIDIASSLIAKNFRMLKAHSHEVKPGYYPCIVANPGLVYNIIDGLLSRDITGRFVNATWNGKRDSTILPNRSEGRRSFLDVGSGNGQQLYIARRFFRFDNCVGLEISKDDVALCRKFFATDPNVTFICDDAFNRKNIYKNPDLIYMWTPMMSHPLMQRLVRHIIKHMKVGAVMLDLQCNLWMKELIWSSNVPHYQMANTGPAIIKKLKENEILVANIPHMWSTDRSFNDITSQTVTMNIDHILKEK